MPFKNLFELIRQSPEARRYYEALPTYVREQMGQRADNINSLASLQDYAENLTRGDA